ncbi:MAG TPA: hypothetical protein VMU29_09785 [Smithella sp.]|nr:hypothetical protein [Smithella sp.]
MKKMFLFLLASMILCSCASYNIETKNGYPTKETLQTELQGRHNYVYIIKHDYYSRLVRGSKNNLTVNEMIDFMLPQIIAMSDIDTFAIANIIDPATSLESRNSFSLQPYYRINNNIIGLRVGFACERPNEAYKSGYQYIAGITYMEYNSDTGKIVKENISKDEANQKRSLFMAKRFEAEGRQ